MSAGEAIVVFGTEEAGIEYRLRPGGYVVLQRGEMLGVVAAPAGFVLPGGGQDLGETPESAAVREAAEECGLVVRLGGRIGTADELVFSADEGVHYRKRCTFFRADLIGRDGAGESDHAFTWLPIGEVERLRFGSQRWAVAAAAGSMACSRAAESVEFRANVAPPPPADG